MSGAIDQTWITLTSARSKSAKGTSVDGSLRRSRHEEELSGKLTAIARSSELKLRCLQNELADAGKGTGAVDGGLYAYGPPVWDSYRSLTRTPKSNFIFIFPTF